MAQGKWVLPLSVVAIAVCGIVYELLIASTSSYLLGDSVWQFSITIGLFMSAMGLGSYLSQHLHRDLVRAFLLIEIVLGCLGGTSVLLLFWAFGAGEGLYKPLMYLLTAGIGCLVGLEIPLLLRITEPDGSLRENAAWVLALDYSGGLIGSVAFPLLLLPHLGSLRTALLIGLLNILVAFVGAYAFRTSRKLQLLAGAAFLSLVALLAVAGTAQAFLEQRLYRDRVVFSAQTPYQHLVLTRFKQDLRLFIDGNLQFSTADEYRYHEALVHPPLTMVPPRGEALILGGGDGLALRELLKHPFERVTLVDLDPEMTKLAKNQPELLEANQRSLFDPRVRVINADAMKFLERDGWYSFIVVDLPDPHGESLNKLYTREFYSLVRRRLTREGAMVVQASSPYFARKAYWCISETVRAAGFSVQNYHLNVPSFGDWGFVMGTLQPVRREHSSLPKTRYLNPATLSSLFTFGGDETRVPVETNTIFRPVLLRYYQQGWRNE